MFPKKNESMDGREATVISGLGNLDLCDTLECGQVFRFELTEKCEDYVEYLVNSCGRVFLVGQRRAGELIFFGAWDEEYERAVYRYFALDTDFEKIRHDLLQRCDSAWFASAAECAKGIVILKQDAWETLFSFIISQNNNIPRIKKIISAISAEYGDNLAVRCGFSSCPLTKETIDTEKCKKCGKCFSFPTPEDIVKRPEGLLPSRPGFRYKYLTDAARRVYEGEISLNGIAERAEYEYTLSELKKILGVGDKVASCVALFGFSNLEAFPIDVWMRRAIDEYFDGKLDPTTLGSYAGVAQQYIFHYIRNLSDKSDD